MLVGFDRTDGDTEFLPTRPTDSCAINKDGGMLTGKEDAERNHHARLDRVCPIDTPAIERQIPSGAGPFKVVTGVVHRTVNGKPAE